MATPKKTTKKTPKKTTQPAAAATPDTGKREHERDPRHPLAQLLAPRAK